MKRAKKRRSKPKHGAHTYKHNSVARSIGEGKLMATITANKFSGFTITGANRIVANLVVTFGEQPGGQVGGTPLVFTITFPRSAAVPPLKMMIGQLTRDLTGGGSTSIGVSATTGDVQVLSGIFPGRDVVWKVTDTPQLKRILQVTITSTDACGTDETWHQELQITKPSGGTTSFDVAIVSGNGSVSSVDVIP